MKNTITILTGALLLMLGGCASQAPLSDDFGNATQHNMAVQIVNPEVSRKAPTYDGAHTADAIKRYRAGSVEEITTESTSNQ